MKIPAIELPSLDQFYREFFCPQLPLIIRGMINGWPAFEKWRYFLFLLIATAKKNFLKILVLFKHDTDIFIPIISQFDYYFGFGIL
jgi:hypothetical protein